MESLEFRSLLCTLAVAHDGMQIEQSEVVDLGAISPGERKEMEFVFSVDGCDNGVDIDIKSWPNEYRIKNPISRRLDADTPTQTLTIVAHAYGDKTYQGVSTGSFRVTAQTQEAKLDPVEWKVELRTHSQPLPGDANSDDMVDFTDFLILARNFGSKTDQALADGDFDNSGEVEFLDFLILAENFGRSR